MRPSGVNGPQRALARYLRDRGGARLDTAKAALDGDERSARKPRPAAEGVLADVAARYLQELPKTWRNADGGTGRRLVAGALFERIGVPALQDATVYLTAHAPRHGLVAVLPETVTRNWHGREEWQPSRSTRRWGESTCPEDHADPGGPRVRGTMGAR